MVVPPLNLPSLRSYSGDAVLSESARRRVLEKPEVGLFAIAGALGPLKPPWGGRAEATTNNGVLPSTKLFFERKSDQRPYHVGSLRNRDRLYRALTTLDGESQLRRLGHALDKCHFEYDMKRQLRIAAVQAKELSNRYKVDETGELIEPRTRTVPKLDKKPVRSKQQQQAESEIEAQEIASQQAAATKIQAIHRGKTDRRMVANALQEKHENEKSRACDRPEENMIFVHKTDPHCKLSLVGGYESGLASLDDRHLTGVIVKGTYKMSSDVEGVTHVELVPDGEEKFAPIVLTLNFEDMLYGRTDES